MMGDKEENSQKSHCDPLPHLWDYEMIHTWSKSCIFILHPRRVLIYRDGLINLVFPITPTLLLRGIKKQYGLFYRRLHRTLITPV